MKDLSRLSREVQIAFNTAVKTKDPKDVEEFERLEDEYCVLLESDRKHRTQRYMSDSCYNDFKNC